MTSYQIQRQDLLTLFRSVSAIAHSRGAAESEQRLAGAMRRLQDGRLATVVCGEFKRGKSSLLGALLEEPGLFPVDVDIATNMVTMISYGAAELINVILVGDGEEEAREITRADIPLYVTEQQNRGNAKNVRLLTIETPSVKLATGLTFVDTPGVGALNQEHTAVTYGFLPAADAVIFVSDATTPLAESELGFVRKISEYCPVILFVITKIDLRDDYAQIVDNTRAKLAEVTGKPADQPRHHPGLQRREAGLPGDGRRRGSGAEQLSRVRAVTAGNTRAPPRPDPDHPRRHGSGASQRSGSPADAHRTEGGQGHSRDRTGQHHRRTGSQEAPHGRA